MENEIYFSNEALARFVAAQNRTVEKVVCHLWQNKIQANNTVELIDNLELHFTDKQKLTIGCNAEGDGLDAFEFNYQQAAKEIESQFEGKIKLFAVNASATKMWEGVIGKTLLAVRLSKSNEQYKADALILDFGEEKREVSISPLDGLVIDYYEE
ncbi:MAG: hypothetical protein JNK73_01120 [Bacteroidia bacterium]|nr:hypothetical protein [Bacteroidia bacterium]